MPPSEIDQRPVRVAVLSGGSSGIGRAIAAAFCERGWRVAFGARRMDRVQETVQALGDYSDQIYGGPLDVTDEASIDRFYAAAQAALGPADVVINCAAHARPGAFFRLSPEEIRAEIDTGLTGALLFSRRGVLEMIEGKRRGDLVFISSTTAGTPWPFHTPYGASKAGLEQASRSIAMELEGTGIRSTIVRVGNTMSTGWANEWDASELTVPVRWQELGLIRHAGFMQPENVAHAVVKAVDTPVGFHLDHISVQPEAPMDPKGDED